MCSIAENVGAYLQKLGFERDSSILPDSVNDHMTYSHLNGYTLAIDDNGNGWRAEKVVNLSPQFELRKVEIVR